MEARANKHYITKSHFEHSLEQGEVVKVIEFQEENYCLAETRGRRASIAINNLDLSGNEWFAGNFSGEEAVHFLLQRSSKHQPMYGDGTFLVRYSSKDNSKFVISMKSGDFVVNCHVHMHGENYSVDSARVTFKSLNELIDFYKRNPLPDLTEEQCLRDIFPTPVKYRFMRIEEHPVVAIVDATPTGKPIINERLLHRLHILYRSDGLVVSVPGGIQMHSQPIRLAVQSAFMKDVLPEAFPYHWQCVYFGVATAAYSIDLIVPPGLFP